MALRPRNSNHSAITFLLIHSDGNVGNQATASRGSDEWRSPLYWNMKRRYITVLLRRTKCKWTSVTSSIVVIYAYVLYLVVRYISYLYILHVFIDRVAERKTTRMEKKETKDVNAPLAVERTRANVHGTAHYCSRCTLATTWPKSICLWRDKLKRAQVSVCFSSRGILKVWQPRPERPKPLPDD